MQLPTVMSDIDLDPMKSTYWLYGYPGSGKTTMAASFGKMLFLYADPGVKVVQAYKEPCTTWSEFEDAAKAYIKNNDLYDGLVIDTIDMMYDFCIRKYLDKKGKDHLSELEWSKGWDMVRNDFGTLIPRLINIEKPLVFLSHAKSEDIKGTAVKTTKQTPMIPGMGRQIVFRLCDAVAYIKIAGSSESNPRQLLFEPSETREGKNRLKFDDSVVISEPLKAFSQLLASRSLIITEKKGGLKKKAKKKIVKKFKKFKG